MKLKKLTFLILWIALLLNSNVFSQQKKDSLDYYANLVQNPNDANELIKAYTFFENHKDVNLENRDTLRAVYDLWHLSSIEYKLGKYYNSENNATQGLRLIENIGNNHRTIPYKVSLLNKIAIIRSNLNDKVGAIQKYKEILNVTSSPGKKGVVHNNIASAYKSLGKFNLAIEQLNKAIQLNTESGNKKELARSLDNLGEVYSKLGISEGINNLEKALSLREEINDHDIYISYKSLSNHYKRKNYKEKAIYYANLGYEKAKEFNSGPYIRNALSLLIDLEGNNYAREFKSVVDSADYHRDMAEVKFAYDIYNLDKEKKKTRKEKIDKEAAQKETMVYGFVGGIILLSSVFLYFYLKSRHKKEKLKKQFETEQRISKKLHDEVANDVYSMMSKLQNDPTTEKELIDNLEEVYLKTRDISKTNASLEVSQNFDQLLKDLITSYKTTNVNIFTRNISRVSWDSLSDLKKETLYRVIQELMTNMRKHSKASLVTLKFEEKNKKILVFYIDDGIGCELKHGNGLRNTENRMELAGGTITFESETNKGFQAKLRI